MRVSLPDRPAWNAADPAPPTLIYGTVTTLEVEPKRKKKRRNKDRPKAPLGFQPPKTVRR